jgi:hypothetical protein
MGALLITAVLIARWIGRELVSAPSAARLAAMTIIPVALLIAQPVLTFGPLQRDPWLIGYFPPNQFHNPTTIASKPLALALFTIGVQALFSRARSTALFVGACALLVIASGLVKPSFLMAFLPAVALLACLRRRRADWRLVIGGLALPAIALLISQYGFHYRMGASGQTVLWAPLVVIGFYSPVDPLTIAWKIVASIVFPLTVVIAFPALLRDGRMRLAWFTFAAGAAFGYLFAEGGGQADAGNFLWSGQLAAFVLFTVCAAALVRCVSLDARTSAVWTRGAACVTALAWHVVSGVRHLHVSWFA